MKSVKKFFKKNKTNYEYDPTPLDPNRGDEDDENVVAAPNSNPDQDALASRRLSLDGDLPEQGLQPDAVDQKDGENIEKVKYEPGLEGKVFIDSTNVIIPVKVGTCGMPGWEPIRGANRRASTEVRKENQDAFCAHAPFVNEKNQLFFAVFDGHGAEGRKVSHYARDTVPEVIQQGYQGHATDGEPDAAIHQKRYEVLKTAYAAAERGLIDGKVDCDPLFSGTTGVCCWILGSDLYCGWVGDSRAVLGRKNQKDKKFKAIDLSFDQKPTRTDEKKRVRQAGARVARWRRNLGPLRVWLPRDWVPGLAMTRSIGDTILTEYGVAPVPEMTYLKLTEADSFVVIASDGVWEFMPSQEVTDFVGKLRRENVSAGDAAESLVREAVRRWRRNEVVVDDTTAVIVYLDYEDETGEKKSAGMFRSKGGAHEKPQQVTDDGKLIPFHPKNDTSEEK